MPRVIRTQTFEYRVTCTNCASRLGFTPQEVHIRSYRDIDGGCDTDLTIECPTCGETIHLPYNYASRLEKHATSEWQDGFSHTWSVQGRNLQCQVWWLRLLRVIYTRWRNCRGSFRLRICMDELHDTLSWFMVQQTTKRTNYLSETRLHHQVAVHISSKHASTHERHQLWSVTTARKNFYHN